MIRRSSDNSPSSRSEPEITVYPTSVGFEVTVGYRITDSWYPCARDFPRTERGVRRARRRLLRWYRAYVARLERAAQLQKEFK